MKAIKNNKNNRKSMQMQWKQ